MYTVVDLIEKCISIEQLGCKLYSDFSNNKAIDGRTKMTAKVLAAEEARHVEIFTEMKNEYSKDNVNIDFEVFDKASKLVQEFKSKLASLNVNNSKELIKYAIDFENANIALLISINDELIKITKNKEIKSSKALGDLIAEERKHADNLVPFLK